MAEDINDYEGAVKLIMSCKGKLVSWCGQKRNYCANCQPHIQAQALPLFMFTSEAYHGDLE